MGYKVSYLAYVEVQNKIRRSCDRTFDVHLKAIFLTTLGIRIRQLLLHRGAIMVGLRDQLMECDISPIHLSSVSEVLENTTNQMMKARLGYYFRPLSLDQMMTILADAIVDYHVLNFLISFNYICLFVTDSIDTSGGTLYLYLPEACQGHLKLSISLPCRLSFPSTGFSRSSSVKSYYTKVFSCLHMICPHIKGLFQFA